MEKVNISVKCPNPKCDAIIKFQKNIALKEIKVPCPHCHSLLQIYFNVDETPQSCKVSLISNTSSINSDSIKEKKTIYKKIKQDPSKNIYKDLYENDISPIKTPQKKRKIKDIYLTYCRFWGLIKERYPLTESKTIVGRYDENFPSDISLKGDDTISRQSIVIYIESDEYGFDYKLKVLNATNIVKVNDKKIKVGEEVFLEFGDIIKLGKSKLIFDNK